MRDSWAGLKCCCIVALVWAPGSLRQQQRQQARERPGCSQSTKVSLGMTTIQMKAMGQVLGCDRLTGRRGLPAGFGGCCDMIREPKTGTSHLTKPVVDLVA